MVAKTAILIIVHDQCVPLLQILNLPFIQLRQKKLLDVPLILLALKSHKRSSILLREQRWHWAPENCVSSSRGCSHHFYSPRYQVSIYKAYVNFMQSSMTSSTLSRLYHLNTIYYAVSGNGRLFQFCYSLQSTLPTSCPPLFILSLPKFSSYSPLSWTFCTLLVLL